jgi:hypothetical protein
MSLSKMIMFAAAAGFVSSAALAAGHNGSPLHSGAQPPAQVLKMKKEIFVTGNGLSTSLPQFQFTTIDTESTSCSKVCTISADVSSQMNTGGADWAICVLVDGATMDCQYQGVQSGPSSFVVGNVTGSLGSLAIGSHTIQTQLYTESASATYQYYAMHYAVHQ